MTITHYACLELLAQRPGLSNSELARGTFARSAVDESVLLQALERQGLVVRPAQAPVMRRALSSTELTGIRGRRQHQGGQRRRFAASSKTCWPIWMPATKIRCGTCSQRASPH